MELKEVVIKAEKKISLRQREITSDYIQKLDNYIANLKAGRESRSLEIADFAEMMHMHPVHLSNTIKEVTGQSSCDLFEERLVKASKELLLEGKHSIGEIASRLTYDPSNFTKFFKRYVGITPKKYRDANFGKDLK